MHGDFKNNIIERDFVLEILKSNKVEEICRVMVSVAYHEKDWIWAQNLFLDLFINKNYEISGLAAVCLGHVARIHSSLDKNKVVNILKTRLNEKEISARILDALDDIEIFVP